MSILGWLKKKNEMVVLAFWDRRGNQDDYALENITKLSNNSYFFYRTGCGMKLRGDDPTAMKDFIVSVQSRVNELKAKSEDAEATTYSKRV